MSAAAMPGFTSGADPVRSSASELKRIARQIHLKVNSHRSASHKPQLDWNETVADEARRHAQNIAVEGFFAHQDPKRGDVDIRLSRVGIDWRRCAENLYEGDLHDAADDAVRAWSESPGHRKNMLDSMFSDAGVGVAIRKDGVLVVVQEFVLR